MPEAKLRATAPGLQNEAVMRCPALCWSFHGNGLTGGRGLRVPGKADQGGGLQGRKLGAKVTNARFPTTGVPEGSTVRGVVGMRKFKVVRKALS